MFSPSASQVPGTGFNSLTGQMQNQPRQLSRISLSGGDESNVIGGKPRGYDTGTSMVPGKGSPTGDSVSANLSPGEAVLNVAAAEHLGRSTIDFLNAIGAQKMGLDVGATADKSSPAKGSKTDSGQKVSNQTGDTPGYAFGTRNVAPAGDPNPTQSMEVPWANQGQSPTAAAIAGSGLVRTPRIVTQTKKPMADAGGDQPQYFAKGTSKVGKQPHSKNSLPPPAVMQALMAMSGGGQPGGGMPPPGGPLPMPMPMPQVQER
jgi:hypothetical protein